MQVLDGFRIAVCYVKFISRLATGLGCGPLAQCWCLKAAWRCARYLQTTYAQQVIGAIGIEGHGFGVSAQSIAIGRRRARCDGKEITGKTRWFLYQKLSEKYAGSLNLTNEQYTAFHNQISEGRNEWERDI